MTKPWRLTHYRAHRYWGLPIGPTHVSDYRWYWQANVMSVYWYYIRGHSCNTWKFTGDQQEPKK